MVIISYIIEMDIHHASPSIWYELGVIDKDKYDELISMDKHKRVVTSGLMQREDSNLTQILHSGYDIFIDKLMKSNNLTEDNILERNHDAVWLLDRVPHNTKFGAVEFIQKHIFKMLYRYKTLSFYIDMDNNIHTRGVRKLENSEMLKLIHRVMLDYLYGDYEECYHNIHKARLKLIEDNSGFGESLLTDSGGNLLIIKAMMEELL